MLALLAAAAAVVAVPDTPDIPPMPAQAMDSISRMPNLYTQPAACRNQPYHVVDRYGRPLPRRLGDLPRAGGAQLLVDRKVNGCRVTTLMTGARAPEPDQPNPPARQPVPGSGRSARSR